MTLTPTTTSSLSQSYFDETVVENENVFDMSPAEAVVETIDQLFKQQQSDSNHYMMEEWKQQQRDWWGISLTHPTRSKQGQAERAEQRAFRQALTDLQQQQQEGDSKVQSMEKILEVWRRDERISEQQKQSSSSSSSKSEEPPILLGNLFWQPTTAADDGHDNDNENGQANDEKSNGNQLLLNHLATLFAAANSTNSAAASTLALQVALKSLTVVVGPKELHRHCQEQLLQQFIIPSLGWERLFSSNHNKNSNSNNNNSIDPSAEQQQILWLQLIYTVCHGHEPNKKYCNSKAILQALVTTLEKQHQSCNGEASDQLLLVEATCRVIAVLCRFDDFSSGATKGQATDNTGMVVSSAHSTVTTLASMGVITALSALLRQQQQQQQQQYRQLSVLLAILQSLRSLAIQDEIVVRMVSTGLMEILQAIFQEYCSTTSTTTKKGDERLPNGQDQQQEAMRLSIITALIGLYRNMSANDELKTTLCRSSKQSILGPLIASLQSLDGIAIANNQSSSTSASRLTKLQEHVCATLGSMALRQPQNAQIIVQDYQGHLVILKAMEMSHHSPLVQRQGALAIRNLASRGSSKIHEAMLDAGAEAVLRKAATLGAVDEAYAALRDLGCHAQLLQANPETGKLEPQAMFGDKPLQFRPVYD